MTPDDADPGDADPARRGAAGGDGPSDARGEDPADRPRPLVVYSDYLCPFCYLGKHSLERYLEAADDPPPVEWRPFDLRSYKRGPDRRIDPDADDWKDEAYFARVRENVARLKEEFGVEMTWDIAEDVDPWNAHKAALFVAQTEDAAALGRFHDAVFDALWRDGRDVGDPEVLLDVAGDVGLDPDAVRDALADDDLDEELAARFDEARRAGITGVPAFVFGGLLVPGAVPPETLEVLVEEARRQGGRGAGPGRR